MRDETDAHTTIRKEGTCWILTQCRAFLIMWLVCVDLPSIPIGLSLKMDQGSTPPLKKTHSNSILTQGSSSSTHNVVTIALCQAPTLMFDVPPPSCFCCHNSLLSHYGSSPCFSFSSSATTKTSLYTHLSTTLHQAGLIPYVHKCIHKQSSKQHVKFYCKTIKCTVLPQMHQT